MYGHSVFQKSTVLLAFFVIFTLPSAELLHAIIPHTHGNGVIGVYGAEKSSHFVAVYTPLSHKEYDTETGTFASSTQPPQHDNSGTDTNPSDVWSFIHFSLRHEQKKVFLVLDTTHLFVQALLSHTQTRFAVFVPIEPVYTNQYERALSRGILAHRTFG